MESHVEQRANIVLQITTILLLVVMLVGLHWFAAPVDPELDPTAMLALGFVVLVSYTIGGIVEGIKLPHITGYILAGLVLGPSVARRLPGLLRFFGVEHPLPAPFDRGVLNPTVIGQLSLLDALAVALIALTAGGELKLDVIRKGLRLVARIISAQALVMFPVITAFMLLISGFVPALTLPGLGGLSLPAAFALAVTVAAITLSTSPAATIAVITETRSEGAFTRTTLSTVILKDVVVLVAFAVASIFAASSLGVADRSGGIVAHVAKHILGSVAAGLILGGGMALYLRYVGAELLLFVVGIVYTATFVATRLHLGPVLLFLSAGFTIANFSPSGDDLVHTVERLSVPVFVVFFTLAGARLHVDELALVLPFALALCLLRLFGMWAGIALAVRKGVDDPRLGRFGFLGFVSQAGVVLSLTQIVGTRLGEPGAILATLLLSGVAINELFGPVLLKAGLSLAGELGQARMDSPGAAGADAAGAQATATSIGKPVEARPDAIDPATDGEDALSRSGLASWKADIGRPDLWGTPVVTRTPALDARMADLESELQALVRDVTRGPLQEFRSAAELYLRELRREFLRHHRRFAVEARSGPSRPELAVALRAAQAELAEKWRGIVCGRSAKLQRAGWSPERLIDAIDQIVDALPETLRADYEDGTFEPRDDDDMVRACRRFLLRVSRGIHRFFRAKMAPRVIELRRLGRYHLSGKAPARLEGLAALFVQADQHLGARTRSIFDGIVSGYESLAGRLDDPELDLEAAVISLRQQVEQELALALEEVRRITRDGTRRTAAVLAKGLVQMKTDVKVYDTLDLPPRMRRSSRVFQRRLKAIGRLTHDLDALRRSNAATYSLLAMELELIGLEARVKEVLGEHVFRLENEVRRRAVAQIERVNAALLEAITTARAALETEARPGELAAALRAATESVGRTAEEASRVISGLQEELVDERKIAPILDALMQATSALTDTYEVVGERLSHGEWKLPAPVSIVRVDFREHVSQHLETHVGPKLLAVTRDLAQKAGPIATALHELERLVAFNVELATAELEVVADESLPEDTQNLLRDMVTGQLERSQAQVQSYVDSCRHFPTDLGAGMRDSVLGAIDAMRSSFLDGQISQTSLGAMRRAARLGRVFHAFGRLPEVVRGSRDHAARTLRALVGEEGLTLFRSRLGLPMRAADLALDPQMFAAPTASAELPMVYRRLFAPDTLEAIDVHTGREKDIDHAIRILAKEAGGKLRSVALVGIDGVGKAAVAAAIMRGRRWKSVRRMTFTEPQSVADVEAVFREGADGQLVVVEGLCWLMGAYPGGFEPLRRFVDGVIHHGARRAFLVHVDDLVWKFATSVAAVGDAFPTVIQLAPLTVEELKSAVIARHDMSGFSHGFDPSSGTSPFDRVVDRAVNRFRRPYDRYFEELHEATGGLVRDALRMWLASIRRVDYGEVVIVGKVTSSTLGALRRLPVPILLQLFQVARQGWTDARTQSHLFRIDERTARAQLARLAHLGLLTENRGVHRIAPHLRGALARLFEEKGWTA